MLVNGKSGKLISIRDRGLLYGDGVFRTLLARAGHALHSQLHLQKIQQDCAKLGIVCPALSRLSDELHEVLVAHPDGIIKLIVTRGQGARGYAPPHAASPTHIWDVAPAPEYPGEWAASGVALHVCDTRLSEQPRLAGIKHLNRLENVLAAAEWSDAQIAEGLMLDAAGHVIEGTRSNLFMVRDGQLTTPDLSRCGVAGVQRDRVIAYAAARSISVQIRDVTLAEVLDADELFLVNSVIGVWPVRLLAERRWSTFPFVKRLQQLDEQENPA
jgi:4-amino-4-deoxychorismate lyase